jgi:hypothetical protein
MIKIKKKKKGLQVRTPCGYDYSLVQYSEVPVFWDLSIVRNSKYQKTQRLGNWIWIYIMCVCVCVCVCVSDQLYIYTYMYIYLYTYAIHASRLPIIVAF